MIGLIVSILVIGLLAGALARLLVPGKQNISVPMTIVLGVVGSFVGGFLGYLLFHKDSTEGFLQPSGIIGSVIGAVVVLVIWLKRRTDAARFATGRSVRAQQRSPRAMWGRSLLRADVYARASVTHALRGKV